MKDIKDWYLILPGCNDTNRGDQALIWETVELAKEAGFNGKYYMIATPEKSQQSKKENIDNIDFILPHPSRHFKKNDNINYGIVLKIKWALVSGIDSLFALALLCPVVRNIVQKIGSEKLQRSLRVYKSARAAFVKGGGFLHAYGGIISTYTVFYDLYHVILALSMGIDVYVMPNSYGPFDGPGSSWLIKKVLSRCKIVTARESISQKYLSDKASVKNMLFPDLAFYLKSNEAFSVEQKEKIKEIPFETKKCVALTMRPYRFPGSSQPKEEYVKYKKTLSEFIVFLNKQGYYPVLIEHTYSEAAHEQDMSCIEDIKQLLGNSCAYMVYSDLSLNCRQLKYVYSKFDYIIGTRFHSVIFSIAAGVPAIAITYGGNKGDGIMEDIGIGDYAINIEKLEIKTLIEIFNNLIQNETDVKEKINSYLNLLSKNRENLINMMRNDK